MKIFKENHSDSQNFLIVSFYTKNFEDKALRLANSLTKFNLSYKIFEIPEIHFSKSNKGSANINYCMPKLILDSLKISKQPILYVDSDIVFKKNPELLFSFKEKKIDFAIYNFVEDDDNEGYLPFKINITENNNLIPKEFYITKVSVPLFNSQNHEKQMLTAGAVAYFSNSEASMSLLEKWLQNIKLFPKAVDDQTLDYTFNIDFNKKKKLNVFWLPKSYCRYSFWIFTDPVINHPDELTYRPEDNFDDITGKKRYIRKNILKRLNAKIDKSHFIDIKKKLILKVVSNKIEIVKKFTDEIFL
jgi:hypothetical protein